MILAYIFLAIAILLVSLGIIGRAARWRGVLIATLLLTGGVMAGVWVYSQRPELPSSEGPAPQATTRIALVARQ